MTFREGSCSSSCDAEIHLGHQKCASRVGVSEHERFHFETPDLVPNPSPRARMSTLHDSRETCVAPVSVVRFHLGIEVPVKEPDPVWRLDRAFPAPYGARCTAEHILGRYLQPTIACAIKASTHVSISYPSAKTDE